MRVVTSHAGEHRLECRYETWVMFTSRPLMPRPDLRPLATRLDDLEGRATWRADAPDALTPGLRPEHGTTLTLPAFLDELRAYLRTAPPAWDPFSRT
jgi:hypothetical protein